MSVAPEGIHIMHKERTENRLKGVMRDRDVVEFLGCEFRCLRSDFKEGDEVTVKIPFDRIELTDNEEDGMINGDVNFILYKGDHYHLTVGTDWGKNLYVDTQDVWENSDHVGIKIAPTAIALEPRDKE